MTHQRRALLLHEAGVPNETIAAELRVKPKSVTSLVWRERKPLEKRLEANADAAREVARNIVTLFGQGKGRP